MKPAPPLAGVRVLSVEQYGAGPYASQHLSEMGADVIKIEPPRGGDSARQSGPHFLAPNESAFFQAFNAGKRSLALDIRSSAGRAVFRRLSATADAVMNNLRGDQPGALGLTYDALKDVRPALVCVHLSGYGRTGSRASWPAYDYLMQAEAGFMALTGEPTGPWTRMGLSIVDYLTGVTAALALTAGLIGAAKTGAGRDLDVTLYDVAVHQLTYPAAWAMNAGEAIGRRPRSGHPKVVPCEAFPTADGEIFIMAMLPKFWEDLCHLLGLPGLIQDPRFATTSARFDNRDVLVAAIDPVLKGRSTAEWLSLFAGKVPAAPILDLEGALANPFLAERGTIQRVDHPLRRGWKALASPVRPDGLSVPSRPAPTFGQHTDEVLAELGVDENQRSDLRRAGVIA